MYLTGPLFQLRYRKRERRDKSAATLIRCLLSSWRIGAFCEGGAGEYILQQGAHIIRTDIWRSWSAIFSYFVLCMWWYTIIIGLTKVNCLLFLRFSSWCVFVSIELAKLDKTERRYAWIKRRMRTNEEIWKIFPPSWHVPYRLSILFCKKTRYTYLKIYHFLCWNSVIMSMSSY